MNAQTNWWETFFEGPAVSLWLQAVTSAQSEAEADRLGHLLALPSAAEVLDVPCGGGRIALALAQRGYRLTAVDGSAEFLEHARGADTNDDVAWARRDMRDLPWPARFDGAVCVGNSLVTSTIPAMRSSCAPFARRSSRAHASY